MCLALWARAFRQKHEHVLANADHQHKQANCQPHLDLTLGQAIPGADFLFHAGNQGQQLFAFRAQVRPHHGQVTGNPDLNLFANLLFGGGFKLPQLVAVIDRECQPDGDHQGRKAGGVTHAHIRCRWS